MILGVLDAGEGVEGAEAFLVASTSGEIRRFSHDSSFRVVAAAQYPSWVVID